MIIHYKFKTLLPLWLAIDFISINNYNDLNTVHYHAHGIKHCQLISTNVAITSYRLFLKKQLNTSIISANVRVWWAYWLFIYLHCRFMQPILIVWVNGLIHIITFIIKYVFQTLNCFVYFISILHLFISQVQIISLWFSLSIDARWISDIIFDTEQQSFSYTIPNCISAIDANVILFVTNTSGIVFLIIVNIHHLIISLLLTCHLIHIYYKLLVSIILHLSILDQYQ